MQNHPKRYVPTGHEVAESILTHLTPAVYAAEHRCFGLTPALDRLFREARAGAAAPMFDDEDRDELLHMFGQAWHSCEAELAPECPRSVIELGFAAVAVLVNYLAEQPAERRKAIGTDVEDALDHVRRLHNAAYSASLAYELADRAEQRRKRLGANVVPFPPRGIFQ
ncbi:hypothetical protein SLNSH_02755 [Alsobacter soli]|uniref:Uncharacterized protein n=1 Tax=Alsobacter soli TaxID=2109933 RepID=A0A2T1HYG3_9HYPH|nr:hypothetical protein [Alsobacter soli]PSC06733.1 hypothetical protein SLNSH_02755 [Alsobacter soli]